MTVVLLSTVPSAAGTAISEVTKDVFGSLAVVPCGSGRVVALGAVAYVTA